MHRESERIRRDGRDKFKSLPEAETRIKRFLFDELFIRVGNAYQRISYIYLFFNVNT